MAAIGYLCALALYPQLRDRAPSWLEWFGKPGSWPTMVVVLAFPAAFFLAWRLAGRRMLADTPFLVLAASLASIAVLGMSAYWRCHEPQSAFFAPLAWTLGLFFGGVQDRLGKGGSCESFPVALELARLFGIATTLTTALAAALTLFRQLDRIVVRRARSLTVAVGIDDDTLSMVQAIAGRMGPRARWPLIFSRSALVVLTGDADRGAVRAARERGAKVWVVGLQKPETLADLRLWKRLDRLYLLSEDPGLNHTRLGYIDSALTRFQDQRIRLPLTVRVDDPWQAEVWRRCFLANDERWVADAVGRYEITAGKLVRHITMKTHNRHDESPPETVLLCGLCPLTYALSSEFAQVHREQALYRKPHVAVPSRVVIVARGAGSFVHDHELRQSRMAPSGAMLSLAAHEAEPTVETIAELLESDDQHRVAVMLVDPSMETEGTRLASRFPNLKVYQASSCATALTDSSLVGQLFPFPTNMDLDPHAPQDAWERAAELIHEHYSQDLDRELPSARPWASLDEFFKQSNRRQVINALWMVEKTANHSWNSLETPPDPPLPENFADLEPLDQLAVLGFGKATVEKMVAIEHEDWCRFYKAGGWRYAPRRADDHRRHEKLKPWTELIDEHPKYAVNAQRSLVSTLGNLRTLGYRSTPRSSGTDGGGGAAVR